MAQYGKSLYGSSFYGYESTLGGQYTSTDFVVDPSLNLSESLDIIADWYLPEASYLYNENIFDYSGSAFPQGALGITYAALLQNTETPGIVDVLFTGQGYTLKYYKGHASFGKLKVYRETYVNGVLESSNTTVIDTHGTGTITSGTLTETTVYGEQRIRISHDATSAADSYVCFEKITSRTTQIFMDVRTYSDEVWGEWTRITPSLALKNATTHRYTATTSSPSITGKTKYQFRYTMISSDTDTTPGILNTEFNKSSATGRFAESGTLNVFVDLKELPTSIDTIDCVTTDYSNTDLRTAYSVSTDPTGAELIDTISSSAFSILSPRYKEQSSKKILIDTKTIPVETTGFKVVNILTPVIDLSSKSFITAHESSLINPQTLDRLTKLVSSHFKTNDVCTSITYNIFNAANWHYVDSESMDDTPIKKYNITKDSSEEMSLDVTELNNVKKIRIRIDLEINMAQMAKSYPAYKRCISPAVNYLSIRGNLIYSEPIRIGGDTYPCYGSAVYNNDSGQFYAKTTIDNVFGTFTASSLNHHLPIIQSTGLPIATKYRIAMANNKYRASELRLTWEDGTTTTSASDKRVKVVMKAYPDYTPEPNVKPSLYKHYQYIRGNIVVGDTRADYVSNAFIPPLNSPDIPVKYNDYSYILKLGFVGPDWQSEENENVDIHWETESIVPEQEHISDSTDNRILISVVDGVSPQSVPWVSGEVLSDPDFPVIVNSANDTNLKEQKIHLEGDALLQIPSYVDIALLEDTLPINVEDPSVLETPYRVAIINRSITEDGDIIDNTYLEDNISKDVITCNVRYTGDSFIEDTVPASGEDAIEITRGAPAELDLLPNSHVIQINKVMRSADGESAWTEGFHYQLGYNNKSIDWSISYENGVLKPDRQENPPPDEGEKYYVEYKYYKLVQLELVFKSEKSELVDYYRAWSTEIGSYSDTMTDIENQKDAMVLTKLTEEELDSLKTSGTIPQGAIDVEYCVRDDNMYISSSVANNEDGNPVVRFKRIVLDPVHNIVPNIRVGNYSLQNREYMLFANTQTTSVDETLGDTSFELSPPPVAGTPVLIAKEDGSALKYVSFIEDDFSKYTVYNSEKRKKPLDGILFLSFDDVDVINGQVEVYNSDGTFVTSTTEIDGKKIAFSEEAVGQMHENIVVKYKLNDSFTMNYSDTGSCIVTLSSIPQETLTVTYDDNTYVMDEKVISWLKFNPIYNHMPYGFVYVTQDPDELDNFFISVSPDCILRDGKDYAIISIDLKDKYSNPVSNAKLSFYNVKYGSITPISTSTMAIEGRAMFKYTPIASSAEAEDLITVMDSVSGLSETFVIKLKSK